MQAAMEEIPVKVAVRIRPLLSKEVLHNHQVCMRLIPNTQQVITGKDRVFTFDFVFGKHSTQEEVYTTCIKPLVSSLIEGYNATVFAYGQTGSGKTYTIGGGHIASVAEEERGIIPRAIQEIFQIISENHNIDFTVKVSYIEVYKEELRDLLELETSMKDLHIREDEKGNTVIVGAKDCQVENVDEVMSLLQMGNAARHTGTTQMNEHSSRSHAVFTISICQQQQSVQTQKDVNSAQDSSQNSGQLIASKFHFVDLAGSERVTKTGNTGERFKESIQINSGLLALGNVISALGDPKRKSAHVPYRDAKITRILKDSLGGNAKTVMITCISPSSSDFDESLNSIKYANRAKNIRNKPVVNYNPNWDRIDEMEFEIKLLREALQNQQVSGQTPGSQGSQDMSQDRNRIRSLEEQLAQLQVESFNYRNCMEEACVVLVDLKNSASLTKSQQERLQDWLIIAQELRREASTIPKVNNGNGSEQDGPYHITILQLKRELKKYQKEESIYLFSVLLLDEKWEILSRSIKQEKALATDAEVFSEKEFEIKVLQDQMQKLIKENEDYLESLKEAQETNRLQNEKMVEQQLIIDGLSDNLEKMAKASASRDDCGDGPAAVISAKRPYTRAYSVPLTKSLIQSVNAPMGLESRKVHTSPPTYSLNRVMAGFRTRSQIILDHIEEQDEVLHCCFSDHSDDDEKQAENKKRHPFRRSLHRTWTRKQIPFSSTLEQKEVQHDSSSQNENISQMRTVTGADIECIQKSQILNMQKLKNSELKLVAAKQKMSELALNIRMKEELIKELVKTGNDAQSVSKQYSLKITQLEHEAEQAKMELAETQKQLQEVENKELRDIAEKARLQKEFRKKMDAAKLKVQVLQKKQQDTKKLASLSTQNEKRVTEVEQNVSHMKNQQAQLQKRLEEESEKKKHLEGEIKLGQQQIKELQQKTEQQEKILKMKDEEIAAFKRRNSPETPQQLQKLEEKKKWLDEELEKVLYQRQELANLEEDLKRREAIISKKEALIHEKSHLEIKKLRSSQALNKDSFKLSSRLSMLDQELCDKNIQLQSSTSDEQEKILEEVQALQKERNHLLKRRNSVDEKLKNGRVLSPEEEHVLFQLEEGIETLEAAIAYKNESIQNHQNSLRASSQILIQNEANMMGKLVSLSATELRAILLKYFNKVVSLRETQRKLQLQNEELEMRVIEQENIVRELQLALEHLMLQCDRRLTAQQKENEQKMQLILRHCKEKDGESITETLKTYEAKVQQLERDLFFYKKTSRELKKKLKELVGESTHHPLTQSKCGSSADVILNQDQANVSSEELKWTSKLSGKLKETDHPLCGFGIQQNPHKCEAEATEAVPSILCLSNSHEEQAGIIRQPAKSYPQVLCHSQPRDTATQLQGVTPVKLSRKELRHIPASELSSRRSGLAAGVNSIPADSIEISRKL
ncbi:kinesin-like protein KIF27 isoform X2 [Hemicordylus capensis]|uniref:kinesin-like protein KIF27 isoform X2 n=1 Tax=Hemicordylus capensis TaxID=884348 RepID=UPI002304968A|nr:kinesin-like protein KIF27 isoform X2 [Hemicordylus capensis]